MTNSEALAEPCARTGGSSESRGGLLHTAIDVGTLRPGRGSARVGFGAFVGGSGEREFDWPDDFVAAVRKIPMGSGVTLGVEAPLWIPVPHEAEQLGAGRHAEGSYAWSSPYGGGAWTTANVFSQLSFVLRALVAGDRWTGVTTRSSWLQEPDTDWLFVWELFGAGKGKAPDAANPHIFDAKRGVQELTEQLADPPSDPDAVAGLFGETPIDVVKVCAEAVGVPYRGWTADDPLRVVSIRA